MRTLILICLILTSVLLGCKSSKKAKETSAKETTEKPANATKKLEVTPIVDAKEDQPREEINETEPAPPTYAIDIPDSLFASIERTPCFGQCPTYKLQIFKSGYTLYEGKKWVDKIGFYKTQTTEEDMKKLIAKAEEIEYFQLKDEYNGPVTDLPTTTTILNLEDGRQKAIKNRFNTPDQLRDFEKFFDAMFAEKEWFPTKGTEGNQD